MKLITSLRDWIATPDAFGVLVPTMGALHEGHLSLVRRARDLGRGPVVVTIFVNRLQFGAGEDFERYPRTLENDCALLAQAGTDFVLAPSESDIYPEKQTFFVHPPAALTDILEGAVRPGHFIGVATVVLKLLLLAQPKAVLFGKKDYQQLRVLQGMVRQMAIPVTVIEGPTIRASDGLALSSRNSYLNASERAQAPLLYAVLQEVHQALAAGERNHGALEQRALGRLREQGWEPDYIAVRRAEDLQMPIGAEKLVVLGAAKLGKVRLIDNIEYP